MSFLCWADAQMPYSFAWLLNTAAILGVAYAMARHKRAWWAWGCFWVLAAVCATEAILKAATPWLDSPWSNASWVCAWLLVGAWCWLVRIARRRLPAVLREIHVIHHHLLHHHLLHHDAGTPPQRTPVTAPPVPQVPGVTPRPAIGGQWHAIAPYEPRAADPAVLLGRLAGRIRRWRGPG